MFSSKDRPSRREMLAAAGRLSIAGAIGTAMAAAGAGTQAAAAAFDEHPPPSYPSFCQPSGRLIGVRQTEPAQVIPQWSVAR
jgi:nitrous oxide reductase